MTAKPAVIYCACGVAIIGDRARWVMPVCVGCLPPPDRIPLKKTRGR